MRNWLLTLFFLFLPLAQPAAAPRVAVEGILSDAAVLKVDGQRKMLRVGQSFGGVTLLAAEGGEATVEIEGRRQVLALSRHIGSNYQVPEEQVVTIRRNGAMQYQTTALINGRSQLVMVDTGANIVAMSANHADSLGINYSQGRPSLVQTASGMVPSRGVTLRSVDVGGIRVDNVEATVVEGGFPTTILLGMSYLRHVTLREADGILSLSRTR